MRRLTGLLLVVSILALSACRSPAPLVPSTVAPATLPSLAPSPAAAATPEPTPSGIASEDAHTAQRMRLVEAGIVGMGVRDPDVIRAMQAVPRHEFIPPEYLEAAYANRPLPIGYGQTISQPYIVALMTEALHLEPGDKVLEIGTGSGYQAAVLAEIVEQVYTVEIIGPLASQAAERLQAMGYGNVEVQHADGYFGWEEHAPYDAIIVTAAPDHVPPPLQAQLADGARLVIPVGPVGAFQELWLVERHGDEFTTRSLGGVSFVPFTREVRDE